MKSKICVDMIILEYHPIVGGAQRQLALVAPLLQERGIDLRILTRRYANYDLPVEDVIEGVPVHRLSAPGSKPLAATTFMTAALRKIQQDPPDIIHAYSLLSPLTTAVVAKRLWQIPIVVKILRGGSQGDLDRVQAKPFSNRRIASYRKYVDTFITISQEIDAELAGINIQPKHRTFIPNGVDIDRFQPIPEEEKTTLRQQLNLPAGPTAVFTGRLSSEKRVDQLVAMWPNVREQCPQANLLLVGTGSQTAALQKRAGNGVHFIGAVNNVVPYLQASDLFVLPSVTEGLSNSLLEAMAVGLPCVVTAVGGAPDVIENGRSGWLVPPDDHDAFKEAVITVLNNLPAQEKLKKQARDVIVKDFALTAVADQLCLLYDSIRRTN